MRIRLLHGAQNIAFDGRSLRYVLKAAPELCHFAVGECVRGARATFLLGEVRLWTFVKSSQGHG